MGYTDIYKEIYQALKADSTPEEQLNVFARKVTDAIWDIKLSIDYGSRFQNTLQTVKEIINNRFETGKQDKPIPPL